MVGFHGSFSIGITIGISSKRMSLMKIHQFADKNDKYADKKNRYCKNDSIVVNNNIYIYIFCMCYPARLRVFKIQCNFKKIDAVYIMIESSQYHKLTGQPH